MAYAFNIEIVLTNKGKPGILFDDLDLERTKIQKKKVVTSSVNQIWNVSGKWPIK